MYRWFLIILLLPSCLYACADGDRETQLRAAYLYNFAQFVEWPERKFLTASAPIVIGILEDANLTEAVARLTRDKQVDDRPIEVLTLRDLSAGFNCHVMYVSGARDETMKQLSDRLADNHVLTVGASENHLKCGGIIRLFLEESKLRFEIRMSRADRADLTLDSRLLRLARLYKE